jgi:hypothetical protein
MLLAPPANTHVIAISLKPGGKTMYTKRSLDLAPLGVTQMTAQETANTSGGYGPAASIVWTFYAISAVLVNTEAALEATGSTLGNGA